MKQLSLIHISGTDQRVLYNKQAGSLSLTGGEAAGKLPGHSWIFNIEIAVAAFPGSLHGASPIQSI